MYETPPSIDNVEDSPINESQQVKRTHYEDTERLQDMRDEIERNLIDEDTAIPEETTFL